MIIGIVGSGAMGAGIAQVAAEAGHQVVVFDKSPEMLDKAEKQMAKVLERLVAKGTRSAEAANALLTRIRFTPVFEDLRDAAWVIEAVVENLSVKKELFAALENLLPPDAILASNTSSLSVTAIAASCKQASRVLGIHFFNPAPLMQLVEVIPALQTDPALVEVVKQEMVAWGKVPVVAHDTPGFIVNRVARPFYGEAIRIFEEGLADMATIDWAMKEIGGFRMGPFELMDYIGHDVNYAVTASVFEAFFFDPRYRPSFAQKRLVDAGFLGRKAGRGFYDYRPDAVRPEPVKDPELGKAIAWRVICMLINEAADALYLRIASRDDLDLAMTRGVNYPKGLLAWADESGIQHCVNTLDRLHGEYLEDRYRCSPLLRKMGRTGKRFYQRD